MTNRMLDVQQSLRYLEKRGFPQSRSGIYRAKAEIPLIPTGPRKGYRARQADLDRWIESRIGIELW